MKRPPAPGSARGLTAADARLSGESSRDLLSESGNFVATVHSALTALAKPPGWAGPLEALPGYPARRITGCGRLDLGPFHVALPPGLGHGAGLRSAGVGPVPESADRACRFLPDDEGYVYSLLLGSPNGHFPLSAGFSVMYLGWRRQRPATKAAVIISDDGTNWSL